MFGDVISVWAVAYSQRSLLSFFYQGLCLWCSEENPDWCSEGNPDCSSVWAPRVTGQDTHAWWTVSHNRLFKSDGFDRKQNYLNYLIFTIMVKYYFSKRLYKETYKWGFEPVTYWSPLYPSASLSLSLFVSLCTPLPLSLTPLSLSISLCVPLYLSLSHPSLTPLSPSVSLCTPLSPSISIEARYLVILAPMYSVRLGSW